MFSAARLGIERATLNVLARDTCIRIAWFSDVRGRSRSLSLLSLSRREKEGSERDRKRPRTSENQASIRRTCFICSLSLPFTMPLLKSYVTWNNKGGAGKNHVNFSHGYALRTDSAFYSFVSWNRFGDRSLPSSKCFNSVDRKGKCRLFDFAT